MNDKFKAIVLNQSGDKFFREIKTLDKKFFKNGDVLVKVDYSSLNYKDALILKNGGKLVKEYPHIPGIDFVGQVVESDKSDFKLGDDVVVTGSRVGEIYPGGYNRDIKINSFKKRLCGKFRPGHFEAVVDVVDRFIKIIKPKKIYFGEKDMQQLKIIEHYVKKIIQKLKLLSAKL